MAGIQIDGTNQKLILDSDADTYLEAATDDTIKVYVSGAEDLRIGANAINVLSGTTLTIDSGATIANSGTATGFGAVTALNNATANELVTVGSTTTELDAESGLTYTDGALVIGGTTPSLTIGDAGAEDTKIVFDGNAQDFHIGLDDTADDLVIGLGSTLGTTTHMAFDETGAITKPLQPSFLAKMSALRSNVTGDNTAYTVAFDTEITDRNADFNTSNYTFTAPVTGLYQINISFLFEGAGDGNEIYHKLVTSNRTKSQQQHVSGTNFGTKVGQNSSHLVDMDASDTATVVVVSAGGTKTLDVYHEDYTHFSGHLVC